MFVDDCGDECRSSMLDVASRSRDEKIFRFLEEASAHAVMTLKMSLHANQ